MKIILERKGTVLHEADAGKLPRTLHIGRGASCEWRVPEEEDSVSSTHARIRRGLMSVTLVDCDSANGIIIAGEKIRQIRLTPGQRLRLGLCILRVEAGARKRAKVPEPYLTFREGGLRTRKARLLQGVNLIGSGVDLAETPGALPMRDLRVSARHAEIEWRLDGCFIRDLGSTNGTFINGEKLKSTNPEKPTERLLRNGDVIGVASREIVYHDGVTADARRMAVVKLLAFCLTLAVFIFVYNSMRKASPSSDFLLEKAEAAAEALDLATARQLLAQAEKAPGAEAAASRARRGKLAQNLAVWASITNLLTNARAAFAEDPGSESGLQGLRELLKSEFATSDAWAWLHGSFCKQYADALSSANTVRDRWSRFKAEEQVSSDDMDRLGTLAEDATKHFDTLSSLRSDIKALANTSVMSLVSTNAIIACENDLALVSLQMKGFDQSRIELDELAASLRAVDVASLEAYDATEILNVLADLNSPKLRNRLAGLTNVANTVRSLSDVLANYSRSVQNFEKDESVDQWRQKYVALAKDPLLQTGAGMQALEVLSAQKKSLDGMESVLSQARRDRYGLDLLLRAPARTGRDCPALVAARRWNVDRLNTLVATDFRKIQYYNAGASGSGNPPTSDYGRLLGFRAFPGAVAGEELASLDEGWLWQSFTETKDGTQLDLSIHQYADLIRYCLRFQTATRKARLVPSEGTELHAMLTNAGLVEAQANDFLKRLDAEAGAEGESLRRRFVLAGCRSLLADALRSDPRNERRARAEQCRTDLDSFLNDASKKQDEQQILTVGLPGFPRFENVWRRHGKD